MPIDINELRDYKGGDPEKWRKYMTMRFKPAEWVDEVLAEDENWRAMQKEVDELRRLVNKLQKEVIAPKKKAKEPCEAEVAEMKEMQKKIKQIQADLPDAVTKRDNLLKRIGNLVDPEVPISQDEEEDNLVIGLHPEPLEADNCGEKPLLPCPAHQLKYTLPETKPLTHDDLLWRIDGYEPIRGQGVAGHRAYFLKNAGVLLNQAIINYSIAFLSKRGYDILQPPYMMNKDVMAGLAQLEDFDEQLYKVSGKTDDPNGSSEKYLIATSEQPICAYHKNEWVEEKSLPLRYGGISTCFRKEAGSSGKDIRGIFRVHQFEKIEQFCLVKDDLEVSQAEQKRMLAAAEDFYQSLGIPYRVVCLVSGELNDAAVKKYDLEGWFPGQKSYRELVSCSNCTDYQARGVGTRCGTKKGDKDLLTRASYCHMLNSTLCATGRGICCILENYQTEDGVKVPEVLQPYMAGIDFLPFKRGALEITKGEKKGKKKK
uniref:serine--tRNA ligase n=1 Tax=Eucampia antarctica TaxID=49252 RepID=A0A7S2WH51_9STRA|mmetsp:Transcript_29637/g.28485  ORF Transcript_29637/g.28485 Transcript_29637/m.28485 type:complete len:485 (+) Transcript_29637:187-1641(+)|eukprot:CAMPEP_0197833004 /NCGR_PEP_ID=MMETSP1437-20131217/17230_1 /TAXON_ID=49252 ORGANISM="Eucampia antarctica, Strain CCMP1452" /NCGR_SAMPLE_ID=MMETSP1437 /ASSEMBLY_ACC=CAM_ASM_001096 /LENGTH=484 /DNA_ID=CAMNT_0043436725 /DNA_START=149 /DNA_END=1603 /DNA_ORIENTATION=-